MRGNGRLESPEEHGIAVDVAPRAGELGRQQAEALEGQANACPVSRPRATERCP
jgi:hypothetical protein